MSRSKRVPACFALALFLVIVSFRLPSFPSFAFPVPAEDVGPPDADSPVQVANHRLLLHRRCRGSYGRYEYSHNSSYNAACNNPANQAYLALSCSSQLLSTSPSIDMSRWKFHEST